MEYIQEIEATYESGQPPTSSNLKETATANVSEEVPAPAVDEDPTQCGCLPAATITPPEVEMLLLRRRMWCCYCCCAGLGCSRSPDPISGNIEFACCHGSCESADSMDEFQGACSH